MRIRTTAVACLLAVVVGATGCSADSGSTDAKHSTTPSPAGSSTASAHTENDCRDLLEKNYTAGAPRDVSGEPECAGLTSDQYASLVGQVLAGKKDEILGDATDEAVWDTAWDGIDAEAQTNICALLLAEGPEAAEGLTQEQAEYYRDNKC